SPGRVLTDLHARVFGSADLCGASVAGSSRDRRGEHDDRAAPGRPRRARRSRHVHDLAGRGAHVIELLTAATARLSARVDWAAAPMTAVADASGRPIVVSD